jgi:hypothetical protein
MREPRHINDDDIDRALKGLVDGGPSRAFRAAVMRQLAGSASPRRARPAWRFALAGVAGAALLAAALGIWSLRVSGPQSPDRATRATTAPSATAAGPDSPAARMPSSVTPPVFALHAGAGTRTSAAGRLRLPLVGVFGQSALAADDATVADAPVVAQISVTPLAAPDPLEVAPLTPTLASAGHPPAGASPVPDLLLVAPLTFDSLKLEKVDVPPLTLPPPAETDIKGKLR